MVKQVKQAYKLASVAYLVFAVAVAVFINYEKPILTFLRRFL